MSIVKAFGKQRTQQWGMGDCSRSCGSEKGFGILGAKKPKKTSQSDPVVKISIFFIVEHNSKILYVCKNPQWPFVSSVVSRMESLWLEAESR